MYHRSLAVDMNCDITKPPHKKKKTNQSPSLLSLPNEIIVNCLAHISKSYYPKLSLVCKTFRDLIISIDLYHARLDQGLLEKILHVCLQLPNKSCPSWFSLWIKPDQTLTNNIKKKKKFMDTDNTLLVTTPSSYTPRVPTFVLAVGSVSYAIKKYTPNPCSAMWVYDKSCTYYRWRKAPSMKVARASAFACILGGKIYVMGGCAAADWAEVFDPKTQTWETLNSPREELCVSPIKKMKVKKGKIYLKNIQGIEYVYDPKENKWEDSKKLVAVIDESTSRCEIDNVSYHCSRENCFWYDRKSSEVWAEVKGLDALNSSRGGRKVVEIANYGGGKLLILWDKFVHPRRQEKNIWCAVVALERRNNKFNNSEVWGNVEWASSVLTVPKSYVFCRCEVVPV